MSPQHPYRIIVCADGSEIQNALIERAFDITNRRPPGEIHVMRVIDVSSGILHRGHQGLVDAAHGELTALTRDIAEAFSGGNGGPTIQIHCRAGEAAEEILQLAADIEADLILVGRHGRSGRRPSVGQVPAALIARAPCPVLVERPLEYELHQLDEEQCPACVAIRHDSHGEHWFCHAHSDGRPFRSTALMGASDLTLHGVY
jgi:nucleotide-binding universal stress UspA family protein